jgi:hypothetical protein
VITIDKAGGRTVQLLLPFTYMGKQVTEVSFVAFRLEHLLRFNEGAWSRPGVGSWPVLFAMMTEFSGQRPEVLKQLRYPDVDNVVKAFMDLLPFEVRDAVIGAQPMPPAPDHEVGPEGELPLGEPAPRPRKQYPADPSGPMPAPAPEDVGGVDISDG